MLKLLITLYLSFSVSALECGQKFFNEKGVESFFDLAPPKVSECAENIIEKVTGETHLIQDRQFKSDELIIDEYAYSTESNELYFGTLEEIDPTFSSNVHCGCKSSSNIEKEQYRLLEPLTNPVKEDYKEYLRNIYSAKLKQTLKDVMELTLNRKRLEQEDPKKVGYFIEICSVAKLKDIFKEVKKNGSCSEAKIESVLPKEFIDNFSKANRNVPEANSCLGYKTQQMLTNSANIQMYSASIINNGQIYDEFTAMSSNMLLVPDREKKRYMKNLGYGDDLSNELDYSMASKQDATTSSIYTRSLASDLENHEKIFDEVYEKDNPQYDIFLHDSTNLGVTVSQEIEKIVLSKVDLSTGEASIDQVASAVKASINEYLNSKPDYKKIVTEGKQFHSLGGDNLKYLNEKVNDSILEKYEKNLSDLAYRTNEKEGGPLSSKMRKISEMGDRFRSKYDEDKLREKRVKENLVDYLNDKDRVFSSHLEKTIKNCEALANPESIKEFMCPFKEGKKEVFLMTAFPPSDELNILTAESSCEEKSIHDDFGFGDDGIASSNNLDGELIDKLKLFDPRTNIYNPNVLENSLNQRNIIIEVACKNVKCEEKNGAKVCNVTQDQILKNLEEQIKKDIAKVKSLSECKEQSYTIDDPKARDCNAIDSLIEDGVKNEKTLNMVSEALLSHGEKEAGDLFKLISAYQQIKSNTIDDVFQSSSELADNSNTQSKQTVAVSEAFKITDPQSASVASLIATGTNDDIENVVQNISSSQVTGQNSQSQLFTSFKPRDNITHTGTTFTPSPTPENTTRSTQQVVSNSVAPVTNNTSSYSDDDIETRTERTIPRDANVSSYSQQTQQSPINETRESSSPSKNNERSPSESQNTASWIKDTPKVSSQESLLDESSNDENAEKLAKLDESLRKLEEQADAIEKGNKRLRSSSNSSSSSRATSSTPGTSRSSGNTSSGLGNALDRANNIAQNLRDNARPQNDWVNDSQASQNTSSDGRLNHRQAQGQEVLNEEQNKKYTYNPKKDDLIPPSGKSGKANVETLAKSGTGGASAKGSKGTASSPSKKQRGPASLTENKLDIKDIKFNPLEFDRVFIHEDFEGNKQFMLENTDIYGKTITTLEEMIDENGKELFVKRVYEFKPTKELLKLLKIKQYETEEEKLELIKKLSKINMKAKKNSLDDLILEKALMAYEMISKLKISPSEGHSYINKMLTGEDLNEMIERKFKGLKPIKNETTLQAQK